MLLKRHYELLKLITYEKREFSLSELAKELNCSTKTVRRDLVQIADDLPTDWFIQSSRKKGIQLNMPTSSSIDIIHFHYFRHTLLFQSLHKLLYNEVKTVDDWCESLYISKSLMRLTLLDIDIFLKKYKLTLKKRPLRIEGNESNIIFMYYELYLKSYDKQEWPFQEFKQNMYTEFFRKVENIMSIKFSSENIRNLSIFISLYLIRIKNENPMFLEVENIKKIEISSSYKKLSQIVKQTFNKYNVSLDSKSVSIIISAMNHVEHYPTKYNHRKKESIKQLFKKRSNGIYPEIKELILLFEDTFHLELLSDEDFLFSILSIFQTHEYKSEIFSKLNSLQETTNYIKLNHTNTFNSIKNMIHTWMIQTSIRCPISENEISILVMHIESIFMKIKKGNKKVILILNSCEIRKKYIKELLKLNYNKQLDYVEVTLEHLRNIQLHPNEISCIITDTPLDNKRNSVPTIFISSIPTKRDLDEIAQFI
ncbi:helix-turn-helix domain-containing protein [Bacillus sp. CDB3]|uniref:helix-turn-helix domain-containing protein n=1 Tax=Bacillus sp. CDB3 TaxID=360310 RepID=UPI0009D7C689|nr:helix-turn-helix domain-containing protein [Bacillus sp. CDB3]OQR53554.1 hypothetical protein CDB3_29035 [Bacillus sp. CDB3]